MNYRPDEHRSDGLGRQQVRETNGDIEVTRRRMTQFTGGYENHNKIEEPSNKPHRLPHPDETTKDSEVIEPPSPSGDTTADGYARSCMNLLRRIFCCGDAELEPPIEKARAELPQDAQINILKGPLTDMLPEERGEAIVALVDMSLEERGESPTDISPEERRKSIVYMPAMSLEYLHEALAAL